MDSKLYDLEPRLLWQHFAALSAIPHGSKNEARIARHVLEEAARLGLWAEQDGAGNVLIRKPAAPGLENRPGVVLQGHLDMVCEKNEGKNHDFANDPIQLIVDGDWVRADNTTLGADNGIGVAAALAVLESAEVVHGPLECLFTIDEETGLTGAYELRPGWLQGRRLLNLDSEEEGTVYIGCAGGLDSQARLNVQFAPATPGREAYRIKVHGLKGGHSGLDIHQGRGNAIKILGRILRSCQEPFHLEIVTIEGGSKRNAIPREAFAAVRLEPGKVSDLRRLLAQIEADLRSELGPADPEVALGLENYAGPASPVMEDAAAKKMIDFLYAGPHGVIAMSPDIPGLVQTSTNLAIVEKAGEDYVVHMSHRSSVESHKRDVGNMVAAYCELAGYSINQNSGYPGWKPNLQSELLRLAKHVHQELFGAEPHVKAIHAGLECGIIGEKYPGMDTISFGPTIMGAHSPGERVSIPAVNNFWKFLLALLEK